MFSRPIAWYLDHNEIPLTEDWEFGAEHPVSDVAQIGSECIHPPYGPSSIEPSEWVLRARTRESD